MRPHLPIAIALITLAPYAAADGALEIDQACIAAGCFPGDQPGFPVEINAEGSYVLTSNLQVPDEHTWGVAVLADFVTIDLGGFVLSGPTVCPPLPDPCGPVGIGRGISGSNSRGITVKNGTIRGFGDTATFLGQGSRIEHVVAEDNGNRGIMLQFSGVVRDCIARNNGGPGISTGSAALIVDNLSLRNRGTGIEAGEISTIMRNTATINGSDGVLVGASCTVIGNAISSNVGAGLSVTGTPATGYADNVLSSNANGSAANQVQGFAVPIGGNLCAGAPCP